MPSEHNPTKYPKLYYRRRISKWITNNDRRKIGNPSTKKNPVFAKTRTVKCIYQKANIIKTNVFPKLRTTLLRNNISSCISQFLTQRL